MGAEAAAVVALAADPEVADVAPVFGAAGTEVVPRSDAAGTWVAVGSLAAFAAGTSGWAVVVVVVVEGGFVTCPGAGAAEAAAVVAAADDVGPATGTSLADLTAPTAAEAPVEPVEAPSAAPPDTAAFGLTGAETNAAPAAGAACPSAAGESGTAAATSRCRGDDSESVLGLALFPIALAPVLVAALSLSGAVVVVVVPAAPDTSLIEMRFDRETDCHIGDAVDDVASMLAPAAA